MAKSPLAFQRLKAAPHQRQLGHNPETAATAPGVASDFESRGDDPMIDPTFQPLSTRQREGSMSQPQALEQTDLAPRCRTTLPKRQRRCRQRENSRAAKRSRRSPQTLRQEFVFGPMTLIEKL